MFAIGSHRETFDMGTLTSSFPVVPSVARQEGKGSRRTWEILGDCSPPLVRRNAVLRSVAIWAGFPNGLDFFGLLEGQPRGITVCTTYRIRNHRSSCFSTGGTRKTGAVCSIDSVRIAHRISVHTALTRTIGMALNTRPKAQGRAVGRHRNVSQAIASSTSSNDGA